jgi:hypothetical protein
MPFHLILDAARMEDAMDQARSLNRSIHRCTAARKGWMIYCLQ